MLATVRRRFSTAGLARLLPYLIATAVVCLIVLITWAAIRTLLEPGDAVVIEVVPIGEPNRVRVQVDGKVTRPGVYDLPVGATVGDAVDIAGGLAEGGQLDAGEAAGSLQDGDLIVVSGDNAARDLSSGPININTATAPELETLPGVGPVIAERIIAFRESNGSFGSADELEAVTGISKRMVDEMRHLIVVESE
ncbi:hypothetical protein BH23CHL2_BH23CHL2_19060 [soil metagenome]